MICKSCNKEIGDNVKFCPYCGQKTGSAGKICPACNKEYGAEHVFCEECGMKLVEKTAQPTPAPQPISQPQPMPRPQPAPAPRPVSNYPSLSYLMSMYEGTGGISKATGKLNVYEDRLEFEKKLGNAAGSAFGLIGIAVASSQAKKNGAVDTYYYRDLKGVSKGSIMLCPSVVLHLKSGRTVSFAGAGMGGNVDRTINIIDAAIMR